MFLLAKIVHVCEMNKSFLAVQQGFLSGWFSTLSLRATSLHLQFVWRTKYMLCGVVIAICVALQMERIFAFVFLQGGAYFQGGLVAWMAGCV